jgi:hypothetical protein
VLQLEVEVECGQIEVEVDVELVVFSSKIIGYFVALKRTEDGASWPPSRAFMAKDARELPCEMALSEVAAQAADWGGSHGAVKFKEFVLSRIDELKGRRNTVEKPMS